MTPEQEAAHRLRTIAMVLESGGHLLSIKDTLNIGNMRGVEVTYDDKDGVLELPDESTAGNGGKNG